MIITNGGFVRYLRLIITIWICCVILIGLIIKIPVDLHKIQARENNKFFYRQYPSKLKQFDIYYSAAVKYLNANNNIKGLYPINLEKQGYLESQCGGYIRQSSNFNWTTTGGWIGEWGSNIGIGINTDLSGAKLIYNKYKKYRIKKVYFPYPNSLTMSNMNSKLINNNLSGELLIVFNIPLKN